MARPVKTVTSTDVDSPALVGRVREQAELAQALVAAAEGRGELMLIAGEAGVGKTRLAEEVLTGSDSLILRAAASHEAEAPYAPIAAVLRAYLRAMPRGLDDCGPLSPHLGLLLPELGPPPGGGDRATLFEAIRGAFAKIARGGSAAVFLDDLNWADDATLELVPVLAGSLEAEPLLLLGAYRSDEIPRGHPLRRLRAELRRSGRLHELVVAPLDAEHTSILAARLLGRPPSPALATTIYLRTEGFPFFVEELVGALAVSERLRDGEQGVELTGDDDLPIPETVRDAVLLRAESLSDTAREALAVASVVGLHCDLELVATLAPEEGLEEAIDRGFLVEVEAGRAAFRHPLMREALYQAVPWARRRTLHREVATRLEAQGGAPAAVAEHWLVARELEPARRALLAAADTSRAVHAYRDAAQAARRALELWPEGEDEADRLASLEQLGHCAELAGDVAGAIQAWQEAREGFRRAGNLPRAAEVERCLAGAYELRGSWDRALAARLGAAEGFAAGGRSGEAAVERLAAAAHLQGAGSFTAALELATAAGDEAELAGRTDLRARALGLEGAVRAKLGEIEAGLEAARAGLSLALTENLTGPAAEAYQRLATVLENASNYPAALDAYRTAFDFCQARGVSGMVEVCMGCLAYIQRQLGEWERAAGVCREVLASAEAPLPARVVALGELGLIHAMRGEEKPARGLLAQSRAEAQRIEFMVMEIESVYGLARVDELEGLGDSAVDHCHFLLRRWKASEDRHYAVPALRWAATFLAQRGRAEDVGACTEALAEIAAGSANTEALAALAHALGEVALLSGEPEQAAGQFGKAIELLQEVQVPLDRAHTELRAGVALAAAGEREAGIDRLADAYRIARKLGARPLARQAAEELAGLGELVDRRLDRWAAAELEHAGLSRRELEVMRLVAAGRTNREIARDLFLSPRTVDMHVRSILRKLDCRSRTEATRKAGELGLLA